MNDLHDLLRKKYKRYYYGHTMPELQYAPTGLLSLDIALGGGLPRGRVVQVYGPASSGKSSLAFTFIRAFQERGEQSLFIDLEGTGQRNDITRHRLREDECFAYACPPDGEIAIQMALDAAEWGARLVIIDSVPYIRTQAAIDKDVGGHSYAAVSRLISENLNKITHTFRTSNSILLLVNQVRANTDSRYGPAYKPAGGYALQHLCSLALCVNKKQKMDNLQGIISTLRVDKTKVARAFQEIELYIYHQSGICEFRDMVQSLLTLNLLERAGAWYSLHPQVAQALGIPPKLGQGVEVVVSWLRENPATKRQLYELAIQRLSALEADESSSIEEKGG